MIRITDEMVESAAAGAWTVAVSGEFSWATLDATSKDAWRREARGALDAALPHLKGATPTCSGCSLDPSSEQGIPDRFIADGDCPVHGEGATPAVDSRGVYEAAVSLQTAEDIAEVIEEYADELDMPITVEWLELRDWFKDLLHEVAAKAREIGGAS